MLWSFVLALPIFPGRLQPSIVSRSELNYCVRNGNRWTLTLISTNSMSSENHSENKLYYKVFSPLCQEVFRIHGVSQIHHESDLGAPSGIRTRDPLIKSQLLYQLS